MGEQRNSRWNWEVTGFEPRKSPSSTSSSPRAPSLDYDEYKPGTPLFRRYSISTASVLSHSELSKQSVATKLQRLNDKVKVSYFILFLPFYVFFGIWVFELDSDGNKWSGAWIQGINGNALETNGNGFENFS